MPGPESHHQHEEAGASSSHEHQHSDTDAGEAPSTTARRPPSYVSEDGVSYVIEARPRSTLPLTSYAPEMVALPNPLPVHPSERGRVGVPPGQ